MDAIRVRMRLGPHDSRDFVESAEAEYPNVEGLADFDGTSGIPIIRPLMDGEIISGGDAEYQDIVADHDGVLFFGWYSP